MEEIWKDVKGYEGYYKISNHGNVKSLSRIKYNQGLYPVTTKEIFLKKSPDKHGYYLVRLTINKKTKTYKIHQLVAIHFLNHKPCGYNLVVNHINLNKQDNRVANLEIVTARENCNKKHIKSTSKYVGVSLSSNKKKWRAYIFYKNKNNALGTYDTEYDAHLAYQEALNKLIPI